MNFDDMNPIQRRLHNAACVLGADGDADGFEQLQRDAIAEIERMRAAARAHSEGRTYTQADLWKAVEAERHSCSIAVWMTLQDALAPDADDKGLDGWMREAEQRVKNRLAHHRTEAHSVEHGLGA